MNQMRRQSIKVCPHCQGTGLTANLVRPVLDIAGIALPPGPGILLALLRQAGGRVVSFAELIVEFEAQGYTGDVNSIKVQMRTLRMKLAEAGTDETIQSRKKLGYRLVRLGDMLQPWERAA